MKWMLIICAFLFGSCSSERIIIIGAGAAGIATATRLLESNITDFKILEAENRIGGRINSIYFGNAFVDLGAQHVHGKKGNLVYELSNKYLNFNIETKTRHAYHSGGRKSGNDLIEDFYSLEEEVWNTKSYNDSFGDVFLKRYKSTILKRYRYFPIMRKYAQHFLRTAESIHIENEGAFSWFKDGAFISYDVLPGPQNLSWKGLGYKTILDILLKNFPTKTGYDLSDKILFGKTATKIITGQNSVKIKCRDGSEFVSNHVVFTPSLGVLKHDQRSIFKPKLNSEKVTAIDSLGFDGAVKIIFEFPNKWWGEEENIYFVWSKKDRREMIEDIPFGPVKNGDHWLSWFSNIAISPKNPKVLIGWFVGPMVPEIEQLTNEQLKSGTVYAMRKILGEAFNVTEPIKIIHSKWYTNPNFRGIYPYETIESNKLHAIDVLIQPVLDPEGTPRIVFAGDAMIRKRYSTVDGAIRSGFREGDRLAQFLSKR